MTPTYGHVSISRSTRIYLHQLYADTKCSLEDMSGAMERERAQIVLSAPLDGKWKTEVCANSIEGETIESSSYRKQHYNFILKLLLKKINSGNLIM